jgi:hypothetical protein
MNVSSIAGGGSFPSLMTQRTVFLIRLQSSLCSLVLCATVTAAHAVDCTQATVLSSPNASTLEQTAIRVLLEETAKRTGEQWDTVTGYPSDTSKDEASCLIVAATAADLAQMLPATMQTQSDTTPKAPESFRVETLPAHGRNVVLVEGRDSRGLLYGVGSLLRAMQLSHDKALVPAELHVSQSPSKPIRGHQLGYRAKNNTYDAWTLAQFEQYIRELALFGTNTIQLIAPESDDAPTSPLFPAPALETLIGTSKILDRYGLDCSIFYPEMESDYAVPENVSRELARFENLFRQVPRVDSIWIPGGDPGHTPPALLFPLVEREVAILRKYHPQAKIYVSAQGMDAAHFEDFYHLLAQHPAWLTGVFFGPQSRDSFEQQRRRIPARYPILFYPDIAHTMHSQFPVPEWDPVFALTEGREPIDPRPADESLIYKHFAGFQDGFITYSEGVNDDVNKFLWTQWGWSAGESAETILHDYSRFFLGPEWTQRFAQGIADLERNWRGPILSNATIQTTATEFEEMGRDPAVPKNNWRFELAQERAYYDALLQSRLTGETAQQQRTIHTLGLTPSLGSASAIAEAESSLSPAPSPQTLEDRAQVFTLAGSLFHHIGLQLSTQLYGASNWERGANLDRIDIPLNDHVWLSHQFDTIRKLPTETEKEKAIAEIVHWDHPVPGTRYDDLGSFEPDLVRHPGPKQTYSSDPELYQTAIDGVSDRTPLDGMRWSQLTYAETLYEAPLRLSYQQLDPNRRYRLRVTYSGEDYSATVGILANNVTVIEPIHDRATNPETLEFEIPKSATESGRLTLAFTRPAGQGGSGRGHQVAETWLIPEP